MIGVVLLILTMVMGFTGYLLPFDQRSFWATVVGVNINGTGPFIGPYLATSCAPGPSSAPTTLSRFYAIHMLLVPGLIIALIGAHLYLVVKLGTTAPPWLEADRRSAEPSGQPGREEAAAGGSLNRAEKEAVPPRVRAAEEAGQALLPLRGDEGLGDGADRRRS